MSRRTDERRAVLWRERMDRFRRAGLSVARFCQREGVSVAAFYYWRKRLDRAPTRFEEPSGGGAFAPLRLVGPTSLSAWLPGGVRLEIPLHDRQALTLALETLARVDAQQRAAHAAGPDDACLWEGPRAC